jgi:D-sedoheptulose 7-phosphate isomerase
MTNTNNQLQESIRAACAVFESLQELAEPVARTADAMVECLCAGRKLLVCGNGGSAADGADFSAEFGCRFVTDRRPYPALNLAQGGSLMSAIGNDYGYDEVFARQVAGLGHKGDVLVAITTSGNSRNILRALEEGKTRGLTTVALLGRDGIREDVMPGHDHGALGGRHIAGNDPHRRRLPGAVRAEKSQDFAPFHGEADVVDRGDRAVAFREVLDLDHEDSEQLMDESSRTNRRS